MRNETSMMMRMKKWMRGIWGLGFQVPESGEDKYWRCSKLETEESKKMKEWNRAAERKRKNSCEWEWERGEGGKSGLEERNGFWGSLSAVAAQYLNTKHSTFGIILVAIWTWIYWNNVHGRERERMWGILWAFPTGLWQGIIERGRGRGERERER